MADKAVASIKLAPILTSTGFNENLFNKSITVFEEILCKTTPIHLVLKLYRSSYKSLTLQYIIGHRTIILLVGKNYLVNYEVEGVFKNMYLIN